MLFLPLVGFFTTIYPTSDLLHVYPYFGLVLISLMVTLKLDFPRYKNFGYLIILLCVISGFYLTLFKGYNRGQPPYSQMDMLIRPPRAAGIYIDSTQAKNINALYAFIYSHTKEDEYIFVYSFSPMLYFLLDRPNPTSYSIYYPGYLTDTEEKSVINDIKKKRVRYIITDWQSNFGKRKPLSALFVDKKKIYQDSQYSIIDMYKK